MDRRVSEQRLRPLSKSKLLAFRQCPKRVWLEIHRPDLLRNSAGTEARFRVGHLVGEIVRRIYDPENAGALIDPNADGFGAAVERTVELLKSDKPVFEASFTANGALAMADVMLPVSINGEQTWRMIEVKSSTSVKDYHRDDAAIQAYIARASQVPLTAISVAHIDSTWVYPGQSDYAGLLVERDVSEEAFSRANEVAQWVSDAQKVAGDAKEPAISPGPHCTAPFECGFSRYCQSQERQPDFSIDLLPGRLSKLARTYIAEENISELRDLPDSVLTERQLRVKRHTLSGETFFDRTSSSTALADYSLPVCFLDFESIQFAVPIWKGTRPYQQIPFQFSLHRLTGSGAIEQTAFLDLSGNDPSRSFSEALIAANRDGEAVFAYNASFEKSRITELAERFPDLAERLLAIGKRLVDLLPIAQRCFYHPIQQGSWSLKALLPAVVPDLAHHALDGVKDGNMAMDAYLEAIHNNTRAARKRQLEQQLIDYCQLDTYALVRIWQVFADRHEIKV